MLARPVALLAPGATFAGILPLCPLGKFPIELVIHSIKGLFGGASTMVVCPSPYTRVKCSDEGGLVATAMGMDERFHLYQMAFLSLLARFDNHLVAFFAVVPAHLELANGEPQKVKTGAAFVFVKRVGDVGFAGFQRQSH